MTWSERFFDNDGVEYRTVEYLGDGTVVEYDHGKPVARRDQTDDEAAMVAAVTAEPVATVEDRLAALEAENEALRSKLVERDVLTVEDVAEVAAKPVKAEVPLDQIRVRTP